MGEAKIIIGDVLESLKSLPSKSVHCCITSPPYYGLRDYGIDGQLGLEKTPEDYVCKMVEVFHEVRRVLRDDGTLWVVIGDSYWGGKGQSNYAFQERRTSKSLECRQHNITGMGETRPQDGNHEIIKPKDLVGIPWRVAFALQADGWYLRQDIIWHKPNPMPESVTDRCTKAHEYIFLLAKNHRYYFDSDAIKEPSKTIFRAREKNDGESAVDTKIRGHSSCCGVETRNRNRRSVWTVSPKSYNGAHFAVFPAALIEPMVLAGCPKDGTVLDPFAGSGTTGEVALKHGRNAILIELNPEYAKLIDERVGKGTT